MYCSPILKTVVIEFILPSAASESLLPHLHPKSIEVKKGHLKAAVKRGKSLFFPSFKTQFYFLFVRRFFCLSLKDVKLLFVLVFLTGKESERVFP